MCLVEAALTRTDGWTKMTTLIDALCNYVNAPTNMMFVQLDYIYTLS